MNQYLDILNNVIGGVIVAILLAFASYVHRFFASKRESAFFDGFVRFIEINKDNLERIELVTSLVDDRLQFIRRSFVSLWVAFSISFLGICMSLISAYRRFEGWGAVVAIASASLLFTAVLAYGAFVARKLIQRSNAYKKLRLELRTCRVEQRT